jgi:hypothetical protein
MIFGSSSVDVNYTEVGSLDLGTLKDSCLVHIFLDKTNRTTLLTTLQYMNGNLRHIQEYVSATEFATVEMKQVLTIYVKRKVCMLDDEYYTLDDPKLHGFISKLSYEGIKYVAEHVVEFAKAFKENKVSELLNIPKPSRKHRG